MLSIRQAIDKSKQVEKLGGGFEKKILFRSAGIKSQILSQKATTHERDGVEVKLVEKQRKIKVDEIRGVTRAINENREEDKI